MHDQFNYYEKSILLITLLLSSTTYAETLTNGPYIGGHFGADYTSYTIDGNTITIQDACHAQNMHN